MSELIQQIVVTKSGTHEEVVVAAALASVFAYLNDPDKPEWEEWLSGPFGKVTRRVDPLKIERISPYTEVGWFCVGDAFASATIPMKPEDVPKELKRLQIQNTEMERTGSWPNEVEGPCLYLNEDASKKMSTGKTAAQAAHALLAWALRQSEEDIEGWTLGGAPVSVMEVSSTLFTDLSRSAKVHIVDNGRTEVEPETSTFLVF